MPTIDIATQLAAQANWNKKIKLLTHASRRVQVASVAADGKVTRALVESWAVMENGTISPMVIGLEVGLVLVEGVIIDLDWPAEKISDDAIRTRAGWTAPEAP